MHCVMTTARLASAMPATTTMPTAVPTSITTMRCAGAIVVSAAIAMAATATAVILQPEANAGRAEGAVRGAVVIAVLIVVAVAVGCLGISAAGADISRGLIRYDGTASK